MRWLDSITKSLDMNLSKLQDITKDRKAKCAAVPGVAASDMTLRLTTKRTLLLLLLLLLSRVSRVRLCATP